MPVEPVTKPAPTRQRVVFGDCQGFDVANAAFVQVSGRGVVFRMRPAPIVVGRQRQDADRASNPVVDAATGEKRTVAAIMLNHEQPEQEGGGGKDEDQAGPEAVMNRCPSGSPEQRERDDGHDKLESAASGSWLAISGKDLQPAFFSEKLGIPSGSLRIFVKLAQRGHLGFLALAAARKFDHRVTP